MTETTFGNWLENINFYQLTLLYFVNLQFPKI